MKKLSNNKNLKARKQQKPKYRQKQATETKQKKKNNYIVFLALLTIVIATLIVFLPTFENEFTNWDDNKYVVENKVIQSLAAENIKEIFSSYHMGNYHPLTILSFAVDYSISTTEPKIDTFFFHLTNILLHLFNTAFVFFIIYFIMGYLHRDDASFKPNTRVAVAFIAALVFGVHTLHVESVSWIAERKDVLYAFFFLLSLIFYIQYVIKNKTMFFIISLILFVFSLFSKGQAVSLSITLVAIDFLFGRKISSKKVILEKIPFFALALLFGIIAIMAQKDAGAVTDGTVHTFVQKTVFAAYGFTQYWIKLIVPLPEYLSALYSYPELPDNKVPIKYWLYLIPTLFILLITILSVKKSKPIAFGLLFFIINIFFVLQFFQVGGAVMADRYSYIPSIGYAFLLAYIFYLISKKSKQFGIIFFVAVLIYSGTLSAFTNQRIKVWKNSLTLWDDVLSKYNTSSEAWVNRATYKYKIALDYPGALSDYNKALAINPKLAEALTGRGVIFRKSGKYKLALADYNEAIKYKPNDADIYSNRGVCKASMGHLDSALVDFDIAIELEPNNAMSRSNRGSAKFKKGNLEGALQDYDIALQNDPTYSEAYSNRGGVKTELGDYEGALADYEKAIYYNPQYSSAYFNRGLMLQRMEKHKSAVEDFTMAIKFEKNSPQVYYVRAISYTELGMKDKACNDFSVAAKQKYQPAIDKFNQLCK